MKKSLIISLALIAFIYACERNQKSYMGLWNIQLTNMTEDTLTDFKTGAALVLLATDSSLTNQFKKINFTKDKMEILNSSNKIVETNKYRIIKEEGDTIYMDLLKTKDKTDSKLVLYHDSAKMMTGSFIYTLKR
ncbi:MAG: hypothetical protein ACK504_04165 [Bacteroidota bacterium]